jgi:hypothetical protein
MTPSFHPRQEGCNKKRDR